MVRIELTDEEIRKAIAYYLVNERDVPCDAEEIEGKITFWTIMNPSDKRIAKATVDIETDESFSSGPYR